MKRLIKRLAPRNKSRGSGFRLKSEKLEPRLLLAAQPIGEVSLVNTFTPGEQSLAEQPAAIAVTPTTRVVVYEGRGPIDRAGVYFDLTNADGSVSLSTGLVNSTVTGEQGEAQVAVFADGGFIVVWSGRGSGDNHGVFFRRYNADGTPVATTETLVNQTIGGRQVTPAVAVAADDSFAIAWSGVGVEDPSGVFLRRYNADGTEQGEEIRVNTTLADHQTQPSLAYETAGDLIVAWQSLHQDGSEWGVYSRRFPATGGVASGETLLSVSTAASQTEVQLATDPTGGIVAAWRAYQAGDRTSNLVARAFSAGGAARTGEVVLNRLTAGVQRGVSIAVAADGGWVAAWNSGVPGDAGWEAYARSFDRTGISDAVETLVGVSGANSGHQWLGGVGIEGDAGWIAWWGDGSPDRKGVYAQRLTLDGVTIDPQQSPNLAPIADLTRQVGAAVEITLTASDPNARDTLTFALDPNESPAGATLTQTSNTTAIFRWTPTNAFLDQVVSVRVLVTDNGEPPLADSERFAITVGEAPLTADLNGTSQSGSDAAAEFVSGAGAASIVSSSLAIVGGDGSVLTGASIELLATPDGAAESLVVDTLGTGISSAYSTATRTLTLTGSAPATDYARVLRTLAYDNVASAPAGDRIVEIRLANAGGSAASVSRVNLSTVAPDLIAFAQGLAATTTRFYGAVWDADTTAQRELFEDGAPLLPFTDVTDINRQLNTFASTNGITELGTWFFPDSTRAVGPLSLQEISQRSGVAIPTSDQPRLASLANTTLLIGSPLHVSLDGYDPNGGVLSYSVTSSNPDVSAEILTGNRSAHIDVQGYGEMVFQLFEDRADRATDRMINLAATDFYDGILFHRVVDGFVIQGGDPDGDGTGGSALGNFDDQFDADLQHNRPGLLSMAKSADDTNNSQFFITEVATRSLDFQHTIFGVMTEGEPVREAISQVQRLRQLPPTDPRFDNGQITGDRPVFDVAIDTIDIFTDNENGVLFLKAAPGATGTSTLTVTVTDEDGNTMDRTFVVTLAPDTSDLFSNSDPFLADIASITTPRNTPAIVPLTGIDVEGDPVFYFRRQIGTVPYTSSVSSTGVLTVTPPTDFVGMVQVQVAVGSRNLGFENADDFQTLWIEFT
ncbi:peptidylprolyl isomerase [Botrimarina hoheduenensis]|uniref:peptidylprolyl isomerase n=1 Tax=Botrimarina hoheduenensis TaxID=2528000 RepID=A0A5C5VSC5_9BACT|nr:peptidylprolyl isomerase [Botrimarina hoheduenensis]TWT40795.1 putative peptidyl-prolyl cis-trans isomerase [Botrimarina hoheduenensis]